MECDVGRSNIPFFLLAKDLLLLYSSNISAIMYSSSKYKLYTTAREIQDFNEPEGLHVSSVPRVARALPGWSEGSFKSCCLLITVGTFRYPALVLSRPRKPSCKV